MSLSALSPALELRTSDLTETQSNLLYATESSWFSSPGFCRLYGNPPAECVSLWLDAGGGLARHCFWSEDRFGYSGRRLVIFGPVQLGGDDVHRLIRESRYDAVTITNVGEYPPGVAAWKKGGLLHEKAVEDFVIGLPPTMDEYFRSLGKQTRKHLPYYRRRLTRELGGSIAEARLWGDQIDAGLLRELVRLNALRMEAKGRRSLWTDQLLRRRAELARQSGLFQGIWCKEGLIAGTLSFLHGSDAFLVLIGHRPEFDRLNAGNLCLLSTIEALIDRRVQRFHLLWGRSSYKLQFNGQPANLHTLTFFKGTRARWSWMVTGMASAGAHLGGAVCRRLFSMLGVRRGSDAR